jgi:glycosyltransferase involved in cell wall biosynthesis
MKWAPVYFTAANQGDWEDRPVRIAQVAPLVESVPPAKYGGTERVIANLTAELVRMGHEVTLYASGDSRTDARLIPLVERALWKSDSPKNEMLLHLAELGRVAREARHFDVVHSHLDVLAFPFGRQSPAPFVHTLHGRLDLPELQTFYDQFSDVPLVSISDSQRRPIPDANWVGRVYNGVAMDTLPFGTGQGGYLAFVGRISPEKGVAEAIDMALKVGMPLKIAARLPLEGLDSSWVALDWAYYNEEVKPRLARSSLIEFVGEVDDFEKGQLLKDAAGMVFPINWPEPFGLVMVEALACGTPVIARALGSTPEVIRHGRTGFLCSTVDEMVDACLRLDSIDRVGCREDVEHRFSARAMAEGYLDVYRRVCGETRHEPSLAPPIRLLRPTPDVAPIPV